eukprot:gene2158-12652_t
MPRFRKGVTYEGDAITSCVFCDIAAQDAGPSTDEKVTELLNGCPKADVQPLLYKDEKCAVFWTRSPECAWHLLVVPLEHIQTVDDMIDQVIAAFSASTWHCLPAGHRSFPRFPRWTFA